MEDQPAPENSDFLRFSQEYSQAVEALAAIEKQAPTLAALGSAGDLVVFLEQFTTMARMTSAEAEARGQRNFVDWFDELVDRAERVRQEIFGQ